MKRIHLNARYLLPFLAVLALSLPVWAFEPVEFYTVNEPIIDPNPVTGIHFGTAVASVGDVDGDGVPDFVVGARGQFFYRGQAYVYSGASGDLIRTLDNPVDSTYCQFGYSVAGIGDVSGDGIPDIAVGGYGVPLQGHYEQGQVFVFSGGDGTLLYALQDPYPDNEGSSYPAERIWFGWSVAGIGDVTGDSTPDIAVGAMSKTVDYVEQGQAFVFSGEDGSLAYVLDDPEPQFVSLFGSAVAGVGDLDGDSVPDVVVGAYGQSVGANDYQGSAFAFSGEDGSFLYRLDDPTPSYNAYFGSALTGVGDVNSDGVPDIAVGARFQWLEFGDQIGQEGRAFVFSGTDGSLIYILDDPSPEPAGDFGASLAAVGDIDGDGVSEIAVGAPWKDNSAKRAFVFSGVDGALIYALESPTAPEWSWFGCALAGLGDVDGDSVPDLAVGAEAEVHQGRVYVYSLALDPAAMAGQVLDFYDASVADGTLEGTGPAASGSGRLRALRNMIAAAQDFADAGDISGACSQLGDAYLRTDGNRTPPDFVIGSAASDLAAMIQEFRRIIDCP